MEVDRNIQVLHALPKREVHILVEIVPVGLTVDEGALEAKLLDGALELRGGGAGVLRGKMGKARIPPRPLLHFARQEVIGVTRQTDRRLCILFPLDAGRSDREYGEIDAGLVHCLQPQLIEVDQATIDVGEQLFALGRLGHKFLGQFRRREVFLERDLAGFCRGLRFLAGRLRHADHLGRGNCCPHRHEVAPAEVDRVRANHVIAAARCLIVQQFHVVLRPDHMPRRPGKAVRQG